jgi:NAD+ kinase
MAIRTVGVAIKPDEPRALDAVRHLAKWLAQHGLRARFEHHAAEAVGEPGVAREVLGREADLLVVLGGDGTLLGMARAVDDRTVPILGINLGTLGFLVEVPVDQMELALARAIAGELAVEPRMRLVVRLLRGGREERRWHALNDAVVIKRAPERIVDLEARADGQLVATYPADGLIVATPTGSTAYALSAGGPILYPTLGAFVLAPICPHTLSNRPVVLPDSFEIEIRVRASDHDATLTVDGQESSMVGPDDSIRVRRGRHTVSLVRSTHSYFEIWRDKLRWG